MADPLADDYLDWTAKFTGKDRQALAGVPTADPVDPATNGTDPTQAQQTTAPAPTLPPDQTAPTAPAANGTDPGQPDPTQSQQTTAPAPTLPPLPPPDQTAPATSAGNGTDPAQSQQTTAPAPTLPPLPPPDQTAPTTPAGNGTDPAQGQQTAPASTPPPPDQTAPTTPASGQTAPVLTPLPDLPPAPPLPDPQPEGPSKDDDDKPADPLGQWLDRVNPPAAKPADPQPADPAPTDPAATDPAATDAAPKLDTGKLQIVDLKNLHSDVDDNAANIDRALASVDTMAGIAKNGGIDVDDPGAAAASLQATGSPVDQTTQGRLNDELLNVSAQRGTMQGFFHQMQNAADAHRQGIARLQALPGPLPQSVWTATDKRKLDEIGTEAEHVWDLVNQFTTAITAVDDPMTMIHALAASDVVKDSVKKLTDEIEVQNAAFQVACATLNKMTAALGQETLDQIAQAQKAFDRAVADYQGAARVYVAALATYEQTFASAVGGSPEDNTQRAAIVRTYTAVLTTSELFAEVKSSLVGGTLKEAEYQAWIDQFVPLGTQIVDAPDSEKPGSITGDWVVYEKNGTQWAYAETAQSLASLVAQLKKVGQFYAACARIEPLGEAWKSAMGKALSQPGGGGGGTTNV